MSEESVREQGKAYDNTFLFFSNKRKIQTSIFMNVFLLFHLLRSVEKTANTGFSMLVSKAVSFHNWSQALEETRRDKDSESVLLLILPNQE